MLIRRPSLMPQGYHRDTHTNAAERGDAGAGMELRQLRYFVETATRLSFRQAAERLCVTQPAISRQISELERELGVALFLRDKRRVALTHAGESLLARAQEILALADETDRTMLTRETTERSSLILGVSSFGNPHATDVLRLYCDQNRDIHVELREASDSASLAKLLINCEVDAAFGRPGEFRRHGLEAKPFWRWEIVALVHPSHPLAARESVPISALATESLLSPSWIWPAVRPHVQKAAFKPRLLGDVMPAGGTALSVLLYVRHAVAFWVPEHIPVPHGTAVVRLDPSPLLSYGLGWRLGESSPAVNALIRLLGELA